VSGVKVSKTIWFGNGYGVEFIISNPCLIDFNVIMEKDPTLVDTTNICIGAYGCGRGDEETMRNFATRARLEGISFAEEMIIEHKETNDLSTILDQVLESYSREDPITKQ